MPLFVLKVSILGGLLLFYSIPFKRVALFLYILLQISGRKLLHFKKCKLARVLISKENSLKIEHKKREQEKEVF